MSRVIFRVEGLVFFRRAFGEARCRGVQLNNAMALVSKLRLVSFDATNTLMTLSRPVGAQYRELLASQMASSAIVGATEDAIEAAFLKAYKQRAGDASCFGAGSMGSTEWWRVLVRNTWVGAGVDDAALEGQCNKNHPAQCLCPPHSITREFSDRLRVIATSGVEESLFESLWAHFAGSDAWELLPGAQELLEALDGYRREPEAAAGAGAGQLQLGVVSDWDERLPGLVCTARKPYPPPLCRS